MLYVELMRYVQELYVKYRYDEVITPQILDVDLWHTSGHYDNYREAMFFTDMDERQFAVKPMNCPTHCLIYATQLRSYRDLPIRYADFGRLHRYERSGVTSGLTRVRSFCQDDAHIFCTDEQIEAEVLASIDMLTEIYDTIGFGEVDIELSTRPEKSIGTPEMWDRAEQALTAALESRDIAYRVNEGDGAFYGPKIDFHVKDALGRGWQLGTVQLDYQLPDRFDLQYVGADGSEHRPVMIHRALLGSLERFIGILVEHTAGAFPVWLAPVQAAVLPLSEKVLDFAETVHARLREAGIRVKLDDRNEKLGYKIREAQVLKVPYMLVVGPREAEAGAVALRLRSGEDLGAVPVDEFVERCQGRDPLARPRALAVGGTAPDARQDAVVEHVDRPDLVAEPVGAGGDHDHHVVLGHDEDVLAAEALRGVDVARTVAVRVGLVDPPEVAVADVVPSLALDVSLGRALHPFGGNDLTIAPAALAQVEQAEARHVARPQVEATTGVRVTLRVAEPVGRVDA